MKIWRFYGWQRTGVWTFRRERVTFSNFTQNLQLFDRKTRILTFNRPPRHY